MTPSARTTKRLHKPARGRALAIAAALMAAVAGLTAVAPAATAGTGDGYVSIGDSLAAGEGEYGTYVTGTNTSANMCHRSNDNYAAQFAQNSIIHYTVTSVGCSGAGVNEILSSANPNSGSIPDAGELPQDTALSASTRLVTVSTGIIDLNLIGDATTCYELPGQGPEDACFRAIPSLPAYQNALAALPAKLASVYSDIRNRAPNATVAVLNYPQIYPTTFTGSCEQFPTPLGPQYLVTSQAMLDTVHSVLNQLNATIAAEVAKYPGFILVDVQNALAGHDLCSSSPWVNQVNGVTVTNLTPDDESLHPTVAGYQAIAKILTQRLDAGYFSDGSTDQNIANAYVANGGPAAFGYPADNGGGVYVHYWNGPQANVEDFTGNASGPVILVDGPQGTFFVGAAFHASYIGGAVNTCQAPIDNAYSFEGATRQDFVNCTMTWTQAGGVAVHTPLAPVADPAPVVYPSNWLSVYSRNASNGHLMQAFCQAPCTGSNWLFADLGGVISGQPSVISYNGQLQVFADGSDGKTMYHKWYDSAGWHDWQSVGCCGEDPATTIYNNDLQLFAIDTGTGHLISAWCSSCDGSDWHFGDLGGVITGPLAVISYNGQLQVIADGSDGKTLYHTWFVNGYGWHAWQEIGCCGADPAVTIYNNDLQLFARDTGTGHLITAWCSSCDGSDWHFGDLGGVITGRPYPVVHGGQLQVLADGGDGTTVWHRWFENGFGWHDWQQIGGPADEPVAAEFGGQLQLISRATDTGHLVHASCSACDGSDWFFEDLGRPPPPGH